MANEKVDDGIKEKKRKERETAPSQEVESLKKKIKLSDASNPSIKGDLNATPNNSEHENAMNIEKDEDDESLEDLNNNNNELHPPLTKDLLLSSIDNVPTSAIISTTAQSRKDNNNSSAKLAAFSTLVKAFREAPISNSKQRELKTAFNLIRSELIPSTTSSPSSTIPFSNLNASLIQTKNSNVSSIVEAALEGIQSSTDLLGTSLTMPNSSPKLTSSIPMKHWGNLISEYSHQPHQKLLSSTITIGRSSRCNIQIRDQFLSSFVAQIIYATDVIILENCSGSVQLAINNEAMVKGMKRVLKSGDRIKIRGTKPFSFIFQKISTNNVSPEKNIKILSESNNANSIDQKEIESKEVKLSGEESKESDTSSRKENDFMDEDENTKFDVNHSILKERENMRRKFVESFLSMIIPPEEIDIDFSSIPYFVCPDLKQLLLTRVFPFLHMPRYAKYMELLKSSSRQLLLTGASGTEIYLENLVKSLAKEMGAYILMLDTIEDINGEIRSDHSAKQHHIIPPKFVDKVANVKKSDENTEKQTEEFKKSIISSPIIPLSSTLENGIESDAHEDDETNVILPNQSKSPVKFLKNVRVKFVGSKKKSDETVNNNLKSTATFSDPRENSWIAMPNRGPMVGVKGTVLVTFEENSSRVGVRFEEVIPGGHGLGSPPLCEESHGYFVETSDLLLLDESPSQDSLEQLSIKTLFSVASKITPEIISKFKSYKSRIDGSDTATLKDSEEEPIDWIPFSLSKTPSPTLPTDIFKNPEEAKEESEKEWNVTINPPPNSPLPCIVCIRDVNATMACNYERFDNFKEVLSKSFDSTTPVVLIGISTRYEHNTKETRSSRGSRQSHTGISFPGGILLSSKNINLSSSLGGDNPWSPLLDYSLDSVPGVAGNDEKMINVLFPCVMDARPPTSSDALRKWNEDIKRDKGTLQAKMNWQCLQRALCQAGISIDPTLTQLECFKKFPISTSSMEKIIALACSTRLRNCFNNAKSSSNSSNSIDNSKPLVKNSSLVLTGLDITQAVVIHQKVSEGSLKLDSHLKSIVTDNDFEKRILESCVIPASQLNVQFKDIGSLDKVKKTMEELIMLPLRRPELFKRGQLINSTRGILLCGPPGTGKTMLAKAVACEAGANFINITASDITSKWFGEAEKCAKAVFTLAYKIAPAVIFIDEIDAILTQRGGSEEHEGMRKIKNEIMASWDGLLSNSSDRVVVLGATNRPFDLDDAVLRRFDRRILVDLPNAEQRRMILGVILKEEELDGKLDLDEIASDNMTKGFSGSDLKSLCVAAAYNPVRDFIKSEQETSNNTPTVPLTSLDSLTPAEVVLRPLCMNDFKLACKEVTASSDKDSKAMVEIKKWIDIYGEGGSRKSSSLPYYS